MDETLTHEVELQPTPMEDAVLGPGTELAIGPLAALLGVALFSHRFLTHLRSGRGAAFERWLRRSTQ